MWTTQERPEEGRTMQAVVSFQPLSFEGPNVVAQTFDHPSERVEARLGSRLSLLDLRLPFLGSCLPRLGSCLPFLGSRLPLLDLNEPLLGSDEPLLNSRLRFGQPRYLSGEFGKLVRQGEQFLGQYETAQLGPPLRMLFEQANDIMKIGNVLQRGIHNCRQKPFLSYSR